VTQISSARLKTDGSGTMSPDDERKPRLTALETRFAQAEPNLSGSRQELIREILDHAEETYFLSSRALANKFDLDPTTIVRTVQALGYKRYGEFAADLRSHFVARITPCAIMKSAVRDYPSYAAPDSCLGRSISC
jgi:DNA-binding MurR/RpiR family transcriptional regulator